MNYTCKSFIKQDFIAHTCRFCEVPLYIHCSYINDHILQVRVQVTVLQINKQDIVVSLRPKNHHPSCCGNTVCWLSQFCRFDLWNMFIRPAIVSSRFRSTKICYSHKITSPYHYIQCTSGATCVICKIICQQREHEINNCSLEVVCTAVSPKWLYDTYTLHS